MTGESVGGFTLNNDLAANYGSQTIPAETDVFIVGGYDNLKSRYPLSVRLVGTDGSTITCILTFGSTSISQ